MTTDRKIEAYPLYWPDGWKRTQYREVHNAFRKPFAEYRDHVFRELELLGASRVILSTNIPLKLNGQPFANYSAPNDPGVALYFTYKEKQLTVACDRYQRVAENLHAIGLTLVAIRGIERWGASDLMERAFRGFTALPSGDIAWKEIMGYGPDAHPSRVEIQNKFRELAHIHHPDKGGDPRKFQDLLWARETALRELEPK